MLSLFRDPRALALLAAASITILSNAIISPSLPAIEASFPDNPDAGLITRLLVTAPALTIAICASLAGMAADRFGRRRQLLLGVALFGVAGSAGLFLPTLELILASRLLLGIAVAMVMTAQTALIGDYFSGPARSQFMGLQIAGVNFGGFLFVSLAGVLAGISPRLPFAIYAVAFLYFPLMWAVLKEPTAAANAPASEEETQAQAKADAGDRSWPVLLGLVVLLTGLTFVCFYMLPTQAPYYLEELGYTDPGSAAMLIATVTLMGGITSLAFSRIRSRLGRGGTPAFGFAVMAAGFALLAFADVLWMATAAAALVGLSTGMIMPTFIGMALDVSPAHRRGMASGAVTTSLFLGQFLSPLLSQPLINTLGYESTFDVSALLLLLLGITALVAFREREPAYQAA